jgi:hypothetical protein
MNDHRNGQNHKGQGEKESRNGRWPCSMRLETIMMFRHFDGFDVVLGRSSAAAAAAVDAQGRPKSHG